MQGGVPLFQVATKPDHRIRKKKNEYTNKIIKEFTAMFVMYSA
jgi:hypothetical protein